MFMRVRQSGSDAYRGGSRHLYVQGMRTEAPIAFMTSVTYV